MTEFNTILDIHEDDPQHTGPIDDPLVARTLLIENARAARKIEMIKQTAALVAKDYADRAHRLEVRQGEIRDQLRLYLERNPGAQVNFPEVGSAHLASRGEKVHVEDADAFSKWAMEHAGERFYREVFDRPAAQAWALQMLRADGETPDGCTYEPAHKSLTIRGPQ